MKKQIYKATIDGQEHNFNTLEDYLNHIRSIDMTKVKSVQLETVYEETNQPEDEKVDYEWRIDPRVIKDTDNKTLGDIINEKISALKYAKLPNSEQVATEVNWCNKLKNAIEMQKTNAEQERYHIYNEIDDIQAEIDKLEEEKAQLDCDTLELTSDIARYETILGNIYDVMQYYQKVNYNVEVHGDKERLVKNTNDAKNCGDEGCDGQCKHEGCNCQEKKEKTLEELLIKGINDWSKNYAGGLFSIPEDFKKKSINFKCENADELLTKSIEDIIKLFRKR